MAALEPQETRTHAHDVSHTDRRPQTPDSFSAVSGSQMLTSGHVWASVLRFISISVFPKLQSRDRAGESKEPTWKVPAITHFISGGPGVLDPVTALL